MIKSDLKLNYRLNLMSTTKKKKSIKKQWLNLSSEFNLSAFHGVGTRGIFFY